MKGNVSFFFILHNDSGDFINILRESWRLGAVLEIRRLWIFIESRFEWWKNTRIKLSYVKEKLSQWKTLRIFVWILLFGKKLVGFNVEHGILAIKITWDFHLLEVILGPNCFLKLSQPWWMLNSPFEAFLSAPLKS